MNKAMRCLPLCILLAPAAAFAEKGALDISVGVMHVKPDIDSPVVRANASTELYPVVNLTYFLTDHFALNTAAGVTRHEFTAGGASLGRATMAPFHLMAQLHFTPKSTFKPYIGAGIHHTVFFDQGGPVFDLLEDFPSDTGAVLQVGLSWSFGKNYFVNLDVKKFYLSTEVKFKGAAAKVETIDLDPLVTSLAVGMRF